MTMVEMVARKQMFAEVARRQTLVVGLVAVQMLKPVVEVARMQKQVGRVGQTQTLGRLVRRVGQKLIVQKRACQRLT